MTIPLSIVQLGRGAIGGTLVDQVRACRASIRARLGIDLLYVGIAGRSGGAFDPGGLALDGWREAVAAARAPGARGLFDAAARGVTGARVLVDATAAEEMAATHREALRSGFHVVTCNKKPLAGPQADYDALQEAARAAGRLYLYEVTVGAGLPVIDTLRSLVDGGDRIVAIDGCFSGTLNALCAGLDRGEAFSQVLARARRAGLTEPDPRDDLGGADVARKAIILAREAGLRLEPAEVRAEPFCVIDPAAPGRDVIAAAAAHDGALERRWRAAASAGLRPRYVARVGEGCGASLVEVPAEGPLGRLAGPENVFMFRTGRYDEHPLVVAGPGAGAEVTAAGALGDILRVARAVARGGSGEAG